MGNENLIRSMGNLRALFQRSIAAKQEVLQGDHVEVLARIGHAICDAIAAGGKLLLCGNGGSASDAQHLAAELLVRLRPGVNRGPVPALTLATDLSTVTACANDYGYEHIFERTLRALGRPGDALLALSTSGASPNVVRALQAARELGIRPLAFLGGDGGIALAECDLAFVAPGDQVGRIQELHITAGHALMELIEDELLERGHIERMP